MGGITSTRRATVLTAGNCSYDEDLIPKMPLDSYVASNTVRGFHVLEISGYTLHRERLRELDSVASAVFAVGDHDWQIRFFPRGVHDSFKDYAAAYLFFRSKNKDVRVRASFEFSLLDVTESVLYTRTGTHEFGSGTNVCCGHHNFIRRNELERSPYLHDDRLTVKCVITLVKDVKPLPEVPPSDIAEHLRKLLQEKEFTDVIFEVEGVAFPAHKTVLAMRSPVFKAKLYGGMRENDMNRIIIGDMQPVVFEALLHFIYTDSLPAAMGDLGRNDYVETSRHLLVAADRYAMERLKIICERILCENIDVNTLVTTLALADQHRCGRLTDACVQFLASLDRMHIDDVMASQAYAELKANCPLVLDELWKKTCRLLGRSKSSLDIGTV